MLNLYQYLPFACIERDFENIREFLCNHFSEDAEKGRFRQYSDSNDISTILEDEIFKDKLHRRIAVIFEPTEKPGSTIFLSNLNDGWYTLVNILSAELMCKIIRVVISDDQLKFPINSLEYYNNGKSFRFVRAMKDGRKWDFFQRGDLLEFENEEHYGNRMIKKRLNREILIGYLKKIGWHVDGKGFWSGQKTAAFCYG